MSLVAVDSSVWIDHLRGADGREASLLREFASQLDRPEVLIVPDLVLYEVLRGARSEASRSTIDDHMSSFQIAVIGGGGAARRAAARYRHLRRTGTTVRKTIDVLIASWCLDHDAALLHRDRDFAPFEDAFGLKTL